jgi:polyphosphate kinase 2
MKQGNDKRRNSSMGKKKGKSKDKGKGKANQKLVSEQAKVPVLPAEESSAGSQGAAPATAEAPAEPRAKLGRKEFEKELESLQVELVKMQEWVKVSGAKICVLFEGRDAAGKGGIIKRITERTSPRVFRVVALPSPSEREKSQMYIQRYIQHLPAAGEVVLFDRSWYNRAGVERVMGFATEEQVLDFLRLAPAIERAIIASGIILVKYWLEETMEDQTERFTERIEDYRKIWKLSPMDLESHRRWYDYSRARDAMFAATDTPETPWYVVDSHIQRRGRLNCIAHLLSLIPYEEVPREKVTLPKRQPKGDYVEPDYPFRRIPDIY